MQKIEMVEEPEDRIRIVCKPAVWLKLILWAAAVAMLLTICPAIEIHAARSAEGQVVCRVYSTLFGLRLSTRTIRDVVGVSVEKNPHRKPGRWDSRSNTFRVVLETASGPVVLRFSFMEGRERHEQAAERLEMFLWDGQRTSDVIVLGAGSWAWGAWIFLMFATVGWTLASPAECLIDKHRDRVTLWRASFPRSKPQTYRLSDVACFGILSRISDQGVKTQSRIVYELGMRLRSGEEIPFHMGASSKKSERREAIVNRLESFRKALYPASDWAPASGLQSIGAASSTVGAKPCVICRLDCANAARFQDENGNYYHRDCFERRFPSR